MKLESRGSGTHVRASLWCILFNLIHMFSTLVHALEIVRTGGSNSEQGGDAPSPFKFHTNF